MVTINSAQRNMDICRRQLAYHEVGHWIVARAAGFKVGAIVLTVHGNLADPKKKFYNFHGEGGSDIYPEPSLASIKDVDDYLLKRMAVLIAGVSAQKLVDDRDVDKIWSEHAVDDLGKLNELSFILRGIRYPGRISRDTEATHRGDLINEAGEVAKSLLENNQKSLAEISDFVIKGVAKLNQKFTFPSESLEEIFKRHHV